MMSITAGKPKPFAKEAWCATYSKTAGNITHLNNTKANERTQYVYCIIGNHVRVMRYISFSFGSSSLFTADFDARIQLKLNCRCRVVPSGSRWRGKVSWVARLYQTLAYLNRHLSQREGGCPRKCCLAIRSHDETVYSTNIHLLSAPNR